MHLKEKIHSAVNKMSIESLTLVYEQIKILENINEKPVNKKKKKICSITQIHKMMQGSNSSWADTIIIEREDRI